MSYGTVNVLSKSLKSPSPQLKWDCFSDLLSVHCPAINLFSFLAGQLNWNGVPHMVSVCLLTNGAE